MQIPSSVISICKKNDNKWQGHEAVGMQFPWGGTRPLGFFAVPGMCGGNVHSSDVYLGNLSSMTAEESFWVLAVLAVRGWGHKCK